MQVSSSGAVSCLCLAFFDFDVAQAGEQPAVAGVAGGHHAVEHVHAVRHAVHEVFGRAHAHQIVRLVRGQHGADGAQHAVHLGLARPQTGRRWRGRGSRTVPARAATVRAGLRTSRPCTMPNRALGLRRSSTLFCCVPPSAGSFAAIFALRRGWRCPRCIRLTASRCRN